MLGQKIKAQSVSEFTIIVGQVDVDLAGIQVYVRRGLQGRLRQASDYVVLEAESHLTKEELSQLDKPQWPLDLNSKVYNRTVFEPELYPWTTEARYTNATSQSRQIMSEGGQIEKRNFGNEGQPGDEVIQTEINKVPYFY